MSKWCPKCQRTNENGDKCDFCGQALEDTSTKDILLNHILQEISDEHKIHNNIYQKKKTRDTLYVEYIADHYRESGYRVTEQGKENNLDNNGIDLIVKKDNEVIFIKCKTWVKNSLDSLDNKEIKILRIDTYDFLEKNPIFKTYKIKMRYTLSGNFIDTSIVAYIDKCKDDISYEIIESKYNKENESQVNNTKILTTKSKSKSKQNKNLEKIIVIILIIMAILYFFKPSGKTEQAEQSDTNKITLLDTKAKQVAQEETQAKHKAKKEQEEQDRIKRLLATQKAERQKHQKEEKERMEKDNAEEMQMVFKKKTPEVQRIDIMQKEVPQRVSKEDARAEAKRKLLDAMKSDKAQVPKTGKEDPREEAKRKLLKQMQLSH